MPVGFARSMRALAYSRYDSDFGSVGAPGASDFETCSQAALLTIKDLPTWVATSGRVVPTLVVDSHRDRRRGGNSFRDEVAARCEDDQRDLIPVDAGSGSPTNEMQRILSACRACSDPERRVAVRTLARYASRRLSPDAQQRRP